MIDQLFRGKMNRDGLVSRAIAQQRQNQWLDGVIIAAMEVGEPCLDKIPIGVGDTTAIFEVHVMRP